MARRRAMSRKEWDRGQTLMRAYMGGKTPFQKFREDQRRVIGDRLATIKYQMRRKVNARIGGKIIKNFTGDKEQLARTQMPFASTLIFSSDSSLEVDLVALAKEIMRMLKVVSEPYPMTTGGSYRTKFRFMIGDKLYKDLPPVVDASIIGITNIHSYSTKTEYPAWPKPFRVVWRLINRVSYTRRVDLRIRNLQGRSEENEGRPWPVPIIEVGYLNTMRTGGRGIGNKLGTQRYRKKDRGPFPIP